MSQLRQKERVRALDAETVLRVLGIDPENPRCPKCRGRFLAEEDACGVSVRCLTGSGWPCRGRWWWPERFAAELWQTPTNEQATDRLLAGVQQRGRTGQLERIAAFLESGAPQ